MSTGRPAWSAAAARALLVDIDEPGPLLVALQALQDAFGYVHPDALPIVADVFNVSRADVYGVLTYYRDLRTSPAPAVAARICMGEACQAVDARRLLAEAQPLAGDDCEVTTVFCLGNCALGPTAVVNGRLLGRATSAHLADAVAAARDAAPAMP